MEVNKDTIWIDTTYKGTMTCLSEFSFSSRRKDDMWVWEAYGKDR